MTAVLAADFEFVRSFVEERSGIVLEADKQYLVESRLTPVAREAGLANVGALVAQVRGNPNNGLSRRLIEAMTTNETSFFRDVKPFEVLRQRILPELIAARAATRRLDIWSAACSSGQEAYTTAMTIREYFPQLATWTIRILGTDLAPQMVARAREGAFSQLEVNRGLPASLLVKYFDRSGVTWRAKSVLREMVEFREMNLLSSWNIVQPMDVVFLRNVLIYFNVPTKRTLLGRVRQLLRPGGCLFLGGAETTLNLDDAYEQVPDKGNCYRVRRT